MVNSAQKTTSYWTDDFYREDARVGKVWGSSDGPWRTFFQVAIARLAKATVSRAWFSISMHHSGSCTASSVELWHTREIDPATAVTWNSTTTAWLDGSALDTRSGKANNSSCGQPPVLLEFGLTNSRVKDLVQQSINAPAPKEALSFGLKIPSANEGNHGLLEAVRPSHGQAQRRVQRRAAHAHRSHHRAAHQVRHRRRADPAQHRHPHLHRRGLGP